MKTFGLLVISFIFLFGFLPVQAQASKNNDFTIVKVGEAELEKDRVVIKIFTGNKPNIVNDSLAIKDFSSLFENDFSFYKKRFEVMKSDKFKFAPLKGKVDFSYWKDQNIRYLIKIGFITKKNIGTNFSIKVFDNQRGKSIFENNSSLPKINLRKLGHKLTNDIYKAITGKDSMFQSKIVFVSDRDTKGSGRSRKVVKELYIMDFDGQNKTQLTHHGGIVISPAISKDKNKILYSLIRGGTGQKNNNLYLYDYRTKKSRLLSKKRGINSGAVFGPGGKEVILTLSHTGNAEIWSLSLSNGKLRRITNHYASDVDPSISIDGQKLVFLSNRPGKAMIYTLDPNGVEREVKRISYVGKYNATPRFSHDGTEIVFSSWLDNKFDLFRINADGSGLSRLTKNFGSNEGPTYSGDGQFIAFSSLRVLSKVKIRQNIHIMNKDGEILGPVTQGFGNCISPRWTK